MVARLVFTLLLVAPAWADSARVPLASDLYLEPLAPGVWLHVATKDMGGEWGVVSANGLVVISEGEAALIDTPWTDEQTRLVATWLREEHGATLALAIPTHSHDDCRGGLAAAHELGAASYASARTIELAREAGGVVPENAFTGRLDLSLGDIVVTLDEPGPGHTVDNIVVWLPGERIVFGGCLVKAAEAKGMGYTAEADLVEWPRTIDRVAARFADAAIIVPGHGKPGGHQLLERTKELIAELGSAAAK